MMKLGFFGQGGVGLIGYATANPGVNGNFSIDVSDIPLRAGDIGILAVGGNERDTIYTISPSMTLLHTSNNTTPYSAVWAGTLVGTETTISTVDADGLDNPVAIYAVFRGVQEPSTATHASDTDTMPDPASITTTAGSYVLAIGYTVGIHPGTAQSGYTLVSSVDSTIFVDEVTVMMSYKLSGGGTEDPDVFGGTNATDKWDANIIELEEAV